MIVKLTHEDVIEACREWLEKHYGIKPGEKGFVSATATHSMYPGENKPMKDIQVTFADAPKPASPYRS